MPRGNRGFEGAMKMFRFSAVALLAVLAGCAPSPHDLIGRNDLEGLKARIASDAALLEDRNRLGKTPLHYAVHYKRLDAMAYLVDAGADINAQDGTGMTPLHVAAMLGRRDEARWLLEHGADPALLDSFGDNPAHTAAIFGMGGVMQLLRDAGCDLRAENAAGLTPLALARKHKQDRVAAHLEKLLS